MQKFVPDHRSIKKTCKKAVKKLPFVIMYVPEQYKTQKMCSNVILENSRNLKVFSELLQEQKNVIKLLIIILIH